MLDYNKVFMIVILIIGFINLFLLIYTKYQFNTDEKNIDRIRKLLIRTDESKCIYGISLNNDNPIFFIISVYEDYYELRFFLQNNFCEEADLLFKNKYNKIRELHQLAKRINHLSKEYNLIY